MIDIWDILETGKSKSVGWVGCDQIDVDKCIEYANENGLKIYVNTDNNWFYIYDYNMLSELLNKHRDKIKHILPLDPEEYIEYIAKNTIVDSDYYNHYELLCKDQKWIVSDDVYAFIGLTFNDNRFNKDLSYNENSVTHYF
jgi:hypothetical protein